METKSIKYTKETFPKKWVVELTDENRQIIGEWFDIYGQFGYNKYTEKNNPKHLYIGFPGIGGSHYFSTLEVRDNNYTIITFEDFKEHILMEKDKNIIGYKLIKPEYKQAALTICNTHGNWENSLMKYDISINQKTYIGKLKRAEVFELWFEPVYEEKFTYKQGDYLYCKNDFLMTDGKAAYIQGKVYHCSGDESITDEEDHYHLMPIQNYDGFPFTHFFRHATKEEISNYLINIFHSL